MSLVTIGIPVFNAEKFIFKSIQSILNQTYQNFELIITDDGSTDKTLKIIEFFKDSRIKVIADGMNRGISFRLNQQINLAQGKYFVRMDADDIMFPDRIEKQVKFLENNKKIDVVGTSVVVLDDEDHIIGYREAILLNEYTDLFNKILFNHPTVAGRIEFFKKFLYSEDLAGVEDADLWIRSFPSSNFDIIKEPLLFYRDPLVFKLKTYKSRLTKKNKLFRSNEYLKSHFILKQKLIIVNNLKMFLATLLSKIHQDQLLISGRNVQNPTNKEDWEKKLNLIIDAK
ncbi:glycosyltransferase [Chryseobacterium indologenes]|uniref:glycosyltransferase family 2 protein n=1 Tax=Chryseobacterium indologenes TaxID=253 RepID=UPI0003E07A2B|nr:glycosyltransferase [Chryseobacterium indologenes]QPQ52426.1 glycosyltransferase [Chryseobacterium indologenes]GAE64705.1 putative glycosyltransferase [Chryseobacterium indologenes NBRC 14944]SFJ85211.1 Glycosyltransferase involved in cell wall bisynthesis [Chryseobacterium indologenes]SUX51068.1 Chondroitin polymerase [Chryseobacterium indologenes]